MVVLELESPSSPGGGGRRRRLLLEQSSLGPTPSASDAAGLGWGPGIGFSNNLPGDAAADG